jgi:hypothetical protein
MPLPPRYLRYLAAHNETFLLILEDEELPPVASSNALLAATIKNDKNIFYECAEAEGGIQLDLEQPYLLLADQVFVPLSDAQRVIYESPAKVFRVTAALDKGTGEPKRIPYTVHWKKTFTKKDTRCQEGSAISVYRITECLETCGVEYFGDAYKTLPLKDLLPPAEEGLPSSSSSSKPATMKRRGASSSAREELKRAEAVLEEASHPIKRLTLEELQKELAVAKTNLINAKLPDNRRISFNQKSWDDGTYYNTLESKMHQKLLQVLLSPLDTGGCLSNILNEGEGWEKKFRSFPFYLGHHRNVPEYQHYLQRITGVLNENEQNRAFFSAANIKTAEDVFKIYGNPYANACLRDGDRPAKYYYYPGKTPGQVNQDSINDQINLAVYMLFTGGFGAAGRPVLPVFPPLIDFKQAYEEVERLKQELALLTKPE